MFGVHHDEIFDIGAERQARLAEIVLASHLDGEKRRVINSYSDPLDRGDEDMAIGVLAQDRGEQLDQRRPADRRAAVKPGSVGGDAHFDLAAIGRIP